MLEGVLLKQCAHTDLCDKLSDCSATITPHRAANMLLSKHISISPSQTAGGQHNAV